MTDYAKQLSILGRSEQDYYCFSDSDSYGNITNYIVIIQNGIMVTFEFITYLEWEDDKAQMFKGITTEQVEFKNLGEYIAYRYNLDIVEDSEKIEKHDFCDLESK